MKLWKLLESIDHYLRYHFDRYLNSKIANRINNYLLRKIEDELNERY